MIQLNAFNEQILQVPQATLQDDHRATNDEPMAKQIIEMPQKTNSILENIKVYSGYWAESLSQFEFFIMMNQLNEYSNPFISYFLYLLINLINLNHYRN